MYKAVIFDFEGTLVHGDQFFSDATVLVPKLKASGMKLGIASNTSVHSISRRLAKNNMQQYFDTIVGIDTVDFVGKPAPNVFVTALENLGVEPHECLVIEDSLSGVNGAVAAGMGVILVRGVRSSHALLECENLRSKEFEDILFG